jgi:hypothetical protein
MRLRLRRSLLQLRKKHSQTEEVRDVIAANFSLASATLTAGIVYAEGARHGKRDNTRDTEGTKISRAAKLKEAI